MRTRTRNSGIPLAIPFASLLAALLMAMPSASSAVNLFEGNLGAESWLHVVDSPATTDRVYWYSEGEGSTYRVQFALDATFAGIVLDVGGIDENYMTPALGEGEFYFRVSSTSPEGTVSGWSSTGTLKVVEDRELPLARILSPAAGAPVSAGEIIPIEIEVADDTGLHLARFTIDGSYAGVLGLKTENFKMKPSYGQSRVVRFEYQAPSRGKIRSIEILVDVSDVMYKSVRAGVVIGAGGEDDRVGRGSRKKK